MFRYVPDAGYVGGDSFRYVARDAAGSSAPATVSITIERVNEAPQARDDTYATTQNTALTLTPASLLSNDSDPDGDPLSVRDLTQPQHGSLAQNSDGTFTYIPNAGYNGPDAFTYRAFDGALDSAPASVSITVTAAPLTANPDTATVLRGSKAPTTGNVLSNDTPNSEADPLKFANPGTYEATYGTLTLNEDGNWVYTPKDPSATPDPGPAPTADLFSYTARDRAGNTASSTLTVQIKTPPVATLPF